MSRRAPAAGDRVAIIGAGIAGIHMAACLKDAGYRHVTIFEARDRVGGKIHTRMFDGLPVEIGAVIIPSRSAVLDFYRRWSLPLADLNHLTVWHASARMWIGPNQRKLGALAFRWAEYGRLRRLIARYREPDPRLDPRDHRWVDLALPFALHLRRAKLPLSLAYMTASLYPYGYGTPDSMPAWYGFEVARAWLPALVEQRWYRVVGGYQQGLEQIVRAADLDVRLGVGIDALSADEGGVRVRFADGAEQDFDFVVNSVPDRVRSPYAGALFADLRSVDYHVGVIDVPHRRGRPDVSRIGEDRAHEANLVYDHHGAQQARPTTGRALATYYCAPNFTAPVHLDPADQAERAHHSLTRYHDVHDYRLRHTETWRYFPQFDAQRIEDGVMADIFLAQGRHRVWNIGASCSFETVPNVVDYNLELLRHFGIG